MDISQTQHGKQMDKQIEIQINYLNNHNFSASHMKIQKSTLLKSLQWKPCIYELGETLAQRVFNLITKVLSTAFLVHLDGEKTELQMSWANQPQAKLYPTSLLEIDPDSLNHTEIFAQQAQSWTFRPLRTVYSHVEISCHCLSPVFLKNVIYAVCQCTVNCFQGISLLQVEANDSKLFCSKLTWHYNSQFYELFACTKVSFLCVQAQEKKQCP